MFFVYLFRMVLKNIEHASIFHRELLHETILCFKMTSCNEEIKLHFRVFFFSFFAFFCARGREREAKAWRARESREDTSKRRSGRETVKAWKPLRRFRRFNILENAENLVMHLFRVKTRIFFFKRHGTMVQIR